MRRAGSVAGIALWTVSCGYIGDPLPPALNIPQPVQDLRAQQVESKVEAVFTIPAQTTENLPVTDLASVELRIGRMPEGGWNEGAWLATARTVAVDAHAPGVVETAVDVGEFAGKDAVLAVRMANRKGRTSRWSNLVTMRIEAPVITPATFVVDSAPNGAILTWKGFPGAVVVYRDGTRIGEGSNGQFSDPRAIPGKVYRYEIQARGDKAVGKRTGPVELTVVDRFPPGAPEGASAVAGAGTVELTWNPNPETDVLGYRVLRATGTGEFATVAPLLDAPAYTDRNVERGSRYRYKVTAFDLQKNESVTSQEVEITVP